MKDRASNCTLLHLENFNKEERHMLTDMEMAERIEDLAGEVHDLGIAGVAGSMSQPRREGAEGGARCLTRRRSATEASSRATG